MKKYSKDALLAFCIMLALGTVMASEYPYGSKVLPGDRDLGTPLKAFAAPQIPVRIGYWDTGVLGLDSNDVVYLHFGPTPPAPIPASPGNPFYIIRSNDIRLTPFADNPAGSKVTASDNDIGQRIVSFPFATFVRYLNLYGSWRFDLADPLLTQMGPPPFISKTNDARLTDSEGMSAGTKLQDSDPDFNRLYALPPIGADNWPGIPGANILYFDRNGNGIYDYPDDVYFRFNIPGPASVSVNDVRLNGPVV